MRDPPLPHFITWPGAGPLQLCCLWVPEPPLGVCIISGCVDGLPVPVSRLLFLPSLTPRSPHTCPFHRVDNNHLLLLMIHVFRENEEQLFRVSPGRWRKQGQHSWVGR